MFFSESWPVPAQIAEDRLEAARKTVEHGSVPGRRGIRPRLAADQAAARRSGDRCPPRRCRAVPRGPSPRRTGRCGRPDRSGGSCGSPRLGRWDRSSFGSSSDRTLPVPMQVSHRIFSTPGAPEGVAFRDPSPFSQHPPAELCPQSRRGHDVRRALLAGLLHPLELQEEARHHQQHDQDAIDALALGLRAAGRRGPFSAASARPSRRAPVRRSRI